MIRKKVVLKSNLNDFKWKLNGTQMSEGHQHLKLDRPRRSPSPPKVLPKGPYKGICIGGGAAGGYQFLGTLHYFYTETDWMKEVNVFGGTSVGACMSAFLAIGYTPHDILTYLCHHNVDDMFSIDLSRFQTDWGVIDTERWKDYIRQAILVKLKNVPTLRELFQLTGNRVCFATWCLTNKPQHMYITTDTHPDVPLDVAIVMSSCIPCVFTRCEYENNLYVDGGIFDTCPSEKTESMLERDERLLVVCFDNYEVPHEIESLSEYIKTIFKAYSLVQKRKPPRQGDEIVLKSDFSAISLKVELKTRIRVFKNAFKRIKYQLFIPKYKKE